MVCGPSGSGKTTYVQENAGKGACIIDLDAIMAELSGRPWYESSEKWLASALQRRNDILRGLASPQATPEAWFIVSAPTAIERINWVRILQPLEVVVLDEPLEVCVTWLQSDSRRLRPWGYFAMLARRWWLRYTPRDGDIVIRNNLSGLKTQDRC